MRQIRAGAGVAIFVPIAVSAADHLHFSGLRSNLAGSEAGVRVVGVRVFAGMGSCT